MPYIWSTASAFSLRSRFILGLAGVLLPFLIASAIGILYVLPAMIHPMERIVEQVTFELDPMRHLQESLNGSVLPVHDFLVHGHPREIDAFRTLRARVEEDFEKVRSSSRPTAGEKAAEVESAFQQWKMALPEAEALFRITEPVANPAGFERMERFDDHLERALVHLDRYHELSHDDFRRELRTAVRAHAGGHWLIYSAFAVALTVSILAGAALARSVLSGADNLRIGAARLAAGELGYRIDARREDEFGELARVFNSMAEQIERGQMSLRELADHDSLTGLLNRREFSRRLNEEFVRSRRYEYSCALLVMDLDNFKRINDTWGHPAGDETLQAVAERIRREIRPSDLLARVGGEEFGVMLPQTDGPGAVRLAERIRKAVCGAPILQIAGERIELTVSIGVAIFPRDAQDEKTLNAAADRGLYAAKRGGRNRICYPDGTLVMSELEPGGGPFKKEPV